MRKKTLDHAILERVALIDKRLVEGLDETTIPTDPQEFLDWWWSQAKVCEECPLCETRNSVVKPDGIPSAKIMVISEGPGFLEDLASVPMVGPLELRSSHCNLCSKTTDCFEHRLLNKLTERGKPAKAVECDPNYTGKFSLKNTFYLRSAGAIMDGILIDNWDMTYPRHNWIKHYNTLHQDQPWTHESPWFFTNVVLCRSTDITGLKDTTPESVPRQKCKRWLVYQWAAVNPELVVCFGRVALGVLMGSEEAAKGIAPNEIVETKFGPVLFQNHPAWFMREKGLNTKAYGFAKVASTLEKALAYVGLPVEKI